MALEPYRQRTSVPEANSGRNIPVVDARLRDVGRDLLALNEQVLQAAEPYLRKKALDQGLADFAADGLGRDENGNFVLPEPQGGGLFYREAYEQAARNQFVRESQDAIETKIGELYADPKNAGLTPEDLLAQSKAIVKGHLDATPPELQGPMFEMATRVTRQYHIRRSDEYRTKVLNDINRSTTNTMDKLQEKFRSAAILGPDTPQVAAQMAVLREEMIGVMKDRIGLGMNSEEDLAQLDYILLRTTDKARFGLEFRTEQENLSSVEMADLVDVLLERAAPDTTVMGYDTAKIMERFPESEDRQELAQMVGAQIAEKAAIEAEIEKFQDFDFSMEATPWGSYGAADTPEKQEKIALEWAQSEGIDLMTPNGILAVVTRFGDLPGSLYKKAFAGIRNWTPERVAGSMDAFGALNNFIGADGNRRDRGFEQLDAQDAAFMDSYLAARNGGLDADGAYQMARIALDKGRAASGPQQREQLRQAFATADDAGLNVKFGEAVGVKWENLGPVAQEWLMDYAGVLIASDAPPETALKRAAQAFKGNFTQDKYAASKAFVLNEEGQWGLGLFGLRDSSKGGWVPKNQAVPGSAYVDNWAEAYVDHALKTRLNPNQGVVYRSEGADALRFGRNVFARFAGEGPDGSRLFNLVYFDRNKSGIPIPLLDKDGGSIVIDLGKAAGSHETQVAAYRVRKNKAERLLEDFRRRAATPGNPIKAAAAAQAYKEARAVFQEEFPSEQTLLRLREKSDTPLTHPGVTVKERDYAPPAVLRQMRENARIGATQPSGVEAKAFNDVSRNAVLHLKRRGRLSDADAVAIVGALQGESGLTFGNRNTYGDTNLGRGEEAIGIAQWRKERRVAFQQFAGKRIEDATIEEQLNFVLHEMRTTERGAWKLLQRAVTLEEKVEVIVHHYLRPKDKEGQTRTRIPYARGIAVGLGLN